MQLEKHFQKIEPKLTDLRGKFEYKEDKNKDFLVNKNIILILIYYLEWATLKIDCPFLIKIILNFQKYIVKYIKI